MAESNLKLNITGDSSKLKSALSSASSQMSSFGSKMQSVGKSMSTRLTLPLVAAGAAATKLALDFDKSMTQIESLVGIASDDVKKMGETAKKMAVDTGKSANEAAEALFFITSAGLKGADATDTLNASLKASAVGLGETKVIADLATSAMNAYGVENLNASASTDIMVAAVREGKLEASALAGAMGGVIPIASNMGVGFDEVGAAMAAMSRTGTGAAEGATQLTAILASIKKPTDGAVQAMAQMGLTTEDVQKSLSEDGLLATLEMLQSGLKQTGQDTTAIFPNIRALKGVLDLTGAGVESTRQIFDSLSNTMGATDEAFLKTSQSASFQFTKGMETMKSSLLEIGQIILPAVVKGVTKFTGFIKGLTDSFKKLSPQTQGFILTFTGILAAAGPILIIFGKIMTGLSALGPVLTVAATGFRLLTMAMVANPILAVATAIAAIGVAIYKYSKAQKAALNESLNIEQVEERLAEKRKKLAEAQAKLAEGYGGQIGKNARILKEEISVLEDKAKALKKIQEVENASASSVETTPTTGAGDTTTISGGGGDEETRTFSPLSRDTVSSVSALESGGIMTPITDAIKADTEAIPAAMEEQQAVLSEQQLLAMENAAAFNVGIGEIITGGLNQLATGIGEALGQAAAGGGNLAKKLSKVVLTTIGNMAVQLGKLSLGVGKTVIAIKAALENLSGPVAIAAGIALIALGSFAKAQAGKIAGGGGATAFANGGIVSGPTMGLVGEYPGAKSNPEVIAPLNKLQGMIGASGGGGGNVNVTGSVRVEGQDLLIAIERANETANRIY